MTQPVYDPRTLERFLSMIGHLDVPLMVGTTADDGGGPLQRAITLDSYRKVAEEMFGEQTSEFMQLFPASSDAEARRSARAAALLGGRQGSAIMWADALTAAGNAPVFAYQFSRTQPYTPGVSFTDHRPETAGAYHTADVPYWLQTLDSLNLFRETRSWTEFDRQLADLMSDAILALARTGTPDHGQFHWPAYEPEGQRIVDFGSDNVLWSAVRWHHIDAYPFLQQNLPDAAPIIRIDSQNQISETGEP
jgi:para-nitrobenzyl esterase